LLRHGLAVAGINEGFLHRISPRRDKPGCIVWINSRLFFEETNRVKTRSGRHNIAEGNCAGAVSSHSELLLTNVARASQEELPLDLQDYLRQNDLPLWGKDSPEANTVRRLGRRDRSDPSDQTELPNSPEDTGDRARCQLYRQWLENKDPP
jgi:hypothetical protein